MVSAILQHRLYHGYRFPRHVVAHIGKVRDDQHTDLVAAESEINVINQHYITSLNGHSPGGGRGLEALDQSHPEGHVRIRGAHDPATPQSGPASHIIL